MARTIAFYRDSLGFEPGIAFPDADSPKYADLTKYVMVLMFIPTKNCGIYPGEKLGTGVNLYMEIDGDIDRYYADLKSKGVNIVTDIKDEPFGIRDFTLEDPHGYPLTFNRRLQGR